MAQSYLSTQSPYLTPTRQSYDVLLNDCHIFASNNLPFDLENQHLLPSYSMGDVISSQYAESQVPTMLLQPSLSPQKRKRTEDYESDYASEQTPETQPDQGSLCVPTDTQPYIPDTQSRSSSSYKRARLYHTSQSRSPQSSTCGMERQIHQQHSQHLSPWASMVHHHHHRLPNPPSPTSQHEIDAQTPSKQETRPESMVGQEGMPAPAPRPKGPKLKFTQDDDTLLVELKEGKHLSWRQIADFFPGRSSGTLQVRYCTKLKAKTSAWTDEMVSLWCPFMICLCFFGCLTFWRPEATCHCSCFNFVTTRF